MANSPLKGTFSNDDILRLVKLPTGNLPTANAGNEGAIVYDDTTNTFKFSNGSAWVDVSGGITGSGSANRLAYWSGASALTSDAGLTYDASTDRLTVDGGVIAGGPSTHGSQTFTITNANNTIPSNKQIVRLISSIGNVSMAGSPSIAAGLYEGQRLITIIDKTSTGNVGFPITPGGGIQPIVSETTLYHYVGDVQEAIEWVWVDGFWKTVSTGAKNPLDIPLSGQNFTNSINATYGLRLDVPNLQTDPGDISFAIDEPRLTISLSTADLLLTQAPTIAAPTTTPNSEFLLLITNRANSGYTLTLQDDNLVTGTNLFLATPQCILRENEWIQLIYTNTEWHEVCRSRVHQTHTTVSLSGLTTLNPRGANTVRVILSGAATLDAPSITTPYGYDNQEMLIWNDAVNTNNLTLEDDGTTAGTNLRLSTTTVALTPGSSIKLKYNITDGFWYEIARTIVV